MNRHQESEPASQTDRDADIHTLAALAARHCWRRVHSCAQPITSYVIEFARSAQIARARANMQMPTLAPRCESDFIYRRISAGRIQSNRARDLAGEHLN